jgi:hypothetical protein
MFVYPDYVYPGFRLYMFVCYLFLFSTRVSTLHLHPHKKQQLTTYTYAPTPTSPSDVIEESLKLKERMARFRDKLEFVSALSCMPQVRIYTVTLITTIFSNLITFLYYFIIQRQLTAAMDSSCAGSFSFKSHSYSSKSEVTDFGEFD